MLNLKLLISKIVAWLYPTNRYVVQRHTGSNKNAAANTNYTDTVVCNKAGYYPVAIVGYLNVWHSGQTALINYYQIYMVSRGVGTCTVQFSYRNMNTAVTNFENAVDILWEKIGGVLRKHLLSSALQRGCLYA